MEKLGASELKEKGKEFRRTILKTIANAGSGHPGGSLSEIDILTVLYFRQMKYDAKRPDWPERDRFILSKGHGCPGLYVVLAEAGYFPKEELTKLRKIGSMLQGHPNNSTPGIEITTGSLGQGLSVANGIALAGRLDKKDYKVYLILGDGELQEGSVWEAAMTAGFKKLSNIIAIVDNNKLAQDNYVKDLKDIEPIDKKFEAFGWETQRINGHDYEEIIDALENAAKAKEKPQLIIADTVKGKGVSFMENQKGWHGKAPNAEQLKQALEELK
ncbi:transketolase [Candidatus Woesearchaeota archaeon]|nr:transketolase [Candidatus Woesearchaeota archaeon]